MTAAYAGYQVGLLRRAIKKPSSPIPSQSDCHAMSRLISSSCIKGLDFFGQENIALGSILVEGTEVIIAKFLHQTEAFFMQKGVKVMRL